MKASLDNIRIPTPCPKTWGELAGDERRRHCDACQLHVTNLSALTHREADEFLATRSGRTCVSYVQRSDGSIVTREERGWTRRPWTWARRGVAALLVLLPFLSGCEQVALEDPHTGSDDVRTLGRPAATLGEVQIAGTIEAEDTGPADAGSRPGPAVDSKATNPEEPK